MDRNRLTRNFIVLAGLLLSLAGCFSNPVDPITSAAGGGGGAVPVNSSDHTTTNIDANYSQANSQGVFVSVRDQDGNALAASYFSSANFQVVYNGTRISSGSITVSTASGSGQSISSSLVLDYSGSMSGYTGDLETAAVSFVNNMQPADRGEVIKFDDTINQIQTYTTDKNALRTAITNPVSLNGLTAFFDATYLGVTNTIPESGQRAVVAFTDGGDNSSTHSMSDLIQYARSNGIPIYTIGFGSASDSILESIASQTNGLYERAGASSDLAGIYQRIAQIFTNTMIISWPSFVYRSGDTITITITYSCSTGTYTSTVNIVLP
ncbi:MAG: VWA domain-containing protein [candidate division FCPU426 bacterium]